VEDVIDSTVDGARRQFGFGHHLDTAGRQASPFSGQFLTFVPVSATFRDESRSMRDAFRMRSEVWGECGASARARNPRWSGASSPSVLRPRREVLSLDWDRMGRVRGYLDLSIG
jgi:hypothetical protein